jgi:lipoprotein signal peptidase
VGSVGTIDAVTTHAAGRRFWRAVVLAAVGVVVTNEAAALIVRARLPLNRSVWLVRPFVLVTHGEHLRPSDFGWFVQLGILLIVGPALAVFLLNSRTAWLAKDGMRGGLLRLGLGCMVGAGLANGAETLVRGSVTNFLAFGRFPEHWTTLHTELYNLADLASYAGEALFLCGLLMTWFAALSKGRPTTMSKSVPEEPHGNDEGHTVTG